VALLCSIAGIGYEQVYVYLPLKITIVSGVYTAAHDYINLYY